ncbi:unnamed protein product [Penicillium roqueforti FM164]|uniref:Genomic scaffold, ProqFM164S04 n=1 Tax=Penicillium roqueforti (strain FM164) TaxID=1365484 RepID=W6R0S3_PENRF|nr:unnamed protein product [Penicillium roqueforti FM164]
MTLVPHTASHRLARTENLCLKPYRATLNNHRFAGNNCFQEPTELHDEQEFVC